MQIQANIINIKYWNVARYRDGYIGMYYWINIFREHARRYPLTVKGILGSPFHNLFVESLTWLFHLLIASCRANYNRALIVIPLICIGATTYPCLPAAPAQLPYSKHAHTEHYFYCKLQNLIPNYGFIPYRVLSFIRCLLSKTCHLSFHVSQSDHVKLDFCPKLNYLTDIW